MRPLINGKSHSWVDIVVLILGIPVAGITAIKYEEKQDKVNNYGSGAYPVSRGKGKKEFSGSITLYSEEVLALQKAAPNQNILDIDPFDIEVSFIPIGSTNITTDILKNCEFMMNGRDTKEGDTSIPVQLDIMPSHIEWNK